MALALYRKYRPQTFAEIIGQEHVSRTLLGEVATNKIAHAYLFSGPRGTGKTSIARIFAKAVNCVGIKTLKHENIKALKKGEPCNECEACTAITSGRALDVIEIDAATHTQVEHVREVIVETARFAPSALKCKFFIIDEAHMLSGGAWNALLKIIEEPPAHVAFILATTEAHKVPATILSRCQRFYFRRLQSEQIIARLAEIAKKEGIAVDEPVLGMLARLSEGCMRDAESLLEQLCALGEKQINEETAALVLPRNSLPDALELIKAVFENRPQSALEQIAGLFSRGAELGHFCDDVMEILRYALLAQVAGDATARAEIDDPTREALSAVAKTAGTKRIIQAIEAFTRARQAIKSAGIPQLPLEVAVVEICEVGSLGERGRAGITASEHARSPSVKGQDLSPVLARPRAAAQKSQNEEKQNGVAGFFSGNPGTSAPSDCATVISLEEVKEKWPEVLKKAQAANHSLSFLLSTGEPVEVREGMLCVGVQYPFHCDKLNEERSRAALERIMGEVYNRELRVTGVLRSPPTVRGDAVEDVLSAFGGRLVDQG